MCAIQSIRAGVVSLSLLALASCQRQLTKADAKSLIEQRQEIVAFENIKIGTMAQCRWKTASGHAVLGIGSTHMQTALKPSTRDRYGRLLDKLMVPRFGETTLADLNGDALALLDAELVQDELAASTRRNVHIVFRSVLRCAVQGGYLETMPRTPKLPPVGRKQPREVRFDDVEAVLAESSESAKLAFSLAAFAGLRASEIRGLRWSDVDLKSDTITVRRALTGGHEVTPKSHHQRVIPSAGRLRALLDAASTKKKNPWAPVATTEAGKLWGEWGLNQALKRAQARAERDGWSFHDLRHFFATELFRRGASAPVVQQLLGHADLATTQRYADMRAIERRPSRSSIAGGR